MRLNITTLCVYYQWFQVDLTRKIQLLNKDELYFSVSIELTGCRETLIAFQNLLGLCLSLFLTLQLGFPNNPYPFDKVPLQKNIPHHTSLGRYGYGARYQNSPAGLRKYMLVYPGVFIALARGFILLRNVCYNESLSTRSNICGFGYAAATMPP